MILPAEQSGELDWVPHVSVNGFFFEESFAAIEGRAFLEYENGWEAVPDVHGDTRIYYCGEMEFFFEDEQLSSVNFENRCVISGSDLIGHPVDEAINAIIDSARKHIREVICVQRDPEPYSFDDPQWCYSIDGTGVIVWSSVETDLVVLISFYKNDQED